MLLFCSLFSLSLVPLPHLQWAVVNSDPLESGTIAHEFVQRTRKRKGLKLNVPSLDNYLDKL